jgi:hypothetical protein
MLPRIPSLLTALSRSVQTDFPARDLETMISLAQETGSSKVTQIVLGPPYTFHPADSTTGGIYTLSIVWSRWQALAVKIFGQDTSFATAQNSNGPPPLPTATPPG